MRYELHLPMMPPILTLINLDRPQAIYQNRPQDLQHGLEMATKTPQDGLLDPNMWSSSLQHGFKDVPKTSQIHE